MFSNDVTVTNLGQYSKAEIKTDNEEVPCQPQEAPYQILQNNQRLL